MKGVRLYILTANAATYKLKLCPRVGSGCQAFKTGAGVLEASWGFLTSCDPEKPPPSEREKKS